MEIVPNSTLYILKNVPLDKTYDHTIYFASKAAQEAAFIAKKKFKCGAQGELSALTYVRVNRGVIRVGIPSEQLYDCNYLMFQNKGFQQSGQSDRWFYAFIESVEYINNTTSEIRFSLDVMQTWYFDYTVEDCFVVREHSTTDVAGDNLLPENVELGDYVYQTDIPSGLMLDWCICVVTTLNSDSQLPIGFSVERGGFYNGVYQQANYNLKGAVGGTFTNAINETKSLLQSLANLGKLDSVLAVYLIPRALVTKNATDSLEQSLQQAEISLNLPFSRPNYHKGSGYTPRNKKLLTYPYQYLYCTTYQGDEHIYKYERFTNPAQINFSAVAEASIEPTVALFPLGYFTPTQTLASVKNVAECVQLSNFPHCAYATSDLGAKFVQRATSFLTAGLANILRTPTVNERVTTEKAIQRSYNRDSGMRSPAYKATLEDVTTSVSTTSGGEVPDDVKALQELIPLAQSSGINSAICRGNLTMAANRFDFNFREMCITQEYAEIIDQYFDRYGYACRKLKRPNTHARKHWTYTRTANCTIAGSMPADDEAKICSIYDSGITFWNNMNEVGEYTTYASDNTPL